MIGHVVQLVEVAHRYPAARLLLVEKGLQNEAGGKDLVARRIEQIGPRHVGVADGLALAAAQAVADGVVERAQLALFQDQGLLLHQAQGGGVGIVQTRARQQLAAVEHAARIHALLVFGEGLQGAGGQVLDLGQPDAVFPGDHAPQGDGQVHDAIDDAFRLLEHLIVVGVDGDVGVHVAIAGVHVQGHEQAAGTDATVDLVDARVHGREFQSAEDLLQGSFHLAPVGDAQVAAQEQIQHPVAVAQARPLRLPEQLQMPCRRLVQVRQQGLPAPGHAFQMGSGRRHLGGDDGAVLAALFSIGQQAHGRQFPAQKVLQGLDHAQLVARGLLDVDALDVLAVFPEAFQGDDHVLVDFEGVGVGCDGRGTGAVGPETAPGLGAGGDEAFRLAPVGQAHHRRGGFAHRGLVVPGQVHEQHHLRQLGTRGLGGVFHGSEIAFVQMFQPGQQHVPAGAAMAHDFTDGVHRALDVGTVEFQAYGTRVAGLAVEDEHRRGDEAVTTLLLYARQAAQEFVGDVLAQPLPAEGPPRQLEFHRLAFHGDAVRGEAGDAETHLLLLVNLAQVVIQALHLQPVGVRGHHSPGQQIVHGGAPQHRLLAAGVHGDVAADGTGVLGSGVHREHQAVAFGQLRHPPRHHARLGSHHRHFPLPRSIRIRQAAVFHRSQPFQLLGIDYRGIGEQGDGAAGIAGTATAGNDGETQIDAGLHHRLDLGLAVWGDHHEGQLHAPVGGVGDVGDPRQTAEIDVVAAGHLAQALQGAGTQFPLPRQPGLEVRHRPARGGHQPQGHLVAVGAGHDLVQAVMEGAGQGTPALGILQQVVLQVRVALHHPHVAQHLEQHARRTAGTAFPPQAVEQFPLFPAQETDDDLPVRERGIVVGNLADACRFLHDGSWKKR